MTTTILKKIKNRQGVSLGETLIALIFCLMTFALVCTAISAAGRELKAVTMQSEAKMLCSTLTTAVEDELRFAQHIDGTDIDSIVYTNSGRASNHLKVEFKNTDDGKIIIKDSTDDTSKIILVPDANYTQGMKAALTLNWNTDESKNNYHCFTGSITVTDGSDNKMCSQTFAVRPINY